MIVKERWRRILSFISCLLDRGSACDWGNPCMLGYNCSCMYVYNVSMSCSVSCNLYKWRGFVCVYPHSEGLLIMISHTSLCITTSIQTSHHMYIYITSWLATCHSCTEINVTVGCTCLSRHSYMTTVIHKIDTCCNYITYNTYSYILY